MNIGNNVKTTLEISDSLFKAAKQAARRNKTTMRALVERGLRLVLEEHGRLKPFRLRDASVDGDGMHPEAAMMSFASLRAMSYGDRDG